ncbi:MAG: flagellar basal body L-ring protein FlgH [Limnochordales bacterium]|nr:flagellar biosynthesis protein FlgH [Bacillota bacterium]
MRSWVRRAACLAVLLALGAGLALPAAANGGSLWRDGDSLFSDRKARRVGDLVTIIIVERAQATQTASTQTGREGALQVGPISLADLLPVIPPISGSASDKSNSSGSTTRGGSVNARMTAKVVEVLPNGNLVIEGRQTIVINGEEQVIVVSGIVRPQDIEPDNTVLSTYIADATIVYNGTGPIGDAQEPGLLTRLLNWLF